LADSFEKLFRVIRFDDLVEGLWRSDFSTIGLSDQAEKETEISKPAKSVTPQQAFGSNLSFPMHKQKNGFTRA
jgi:hypothetical protein